MIVKHWVIVEVEDLKEGGDILYTLGQRVFGRIVAQDVKDPVSGEIILKQEILFCVMI